MHSRSRLGSRLTVGVVLLAFLSAVPAMATGSKQGTRSCPASWYVGVTSETTGPTRHYAPLGHLIGTYNNGVFLQARYSLSGLQSTSWKAETNGYMNYGLTFSYCY